MALDYLRKNKFRIIAKSFRYKRGEIDLIAWQGHTLVFIEVKTRRISPFGSPEESIDRAKRIQLRRIARDYLFLNRIEDVECRFDVITLTRDSRGEYSVNHIRDAF